MEHEKIGIRIGLEIHHELDTQKKLFCNCSTELVRDEPDIIIERYQRAVAGETGEIDIAALEELKKGRKIIYEAYSDANCLVETDETPPLAPNEEALKIAMTIAMLFDCDIVDEIHVMRKTIVDGSLPSGFQRTMLIGTDGCIETSQGKVEIEAVSLEEDSGRLIRKDDKSITFKLDRLGIPEVEVGTGSGIVSPEHAKEVAKRIGDTIRSTGKAKIREGSVRQDINVSIKGGARVEIKHVPSLSLIPTIIEKEIKRQQKLIKSGKKVSRDVRRVLPDGSTEFLRPLPGAARMYPETDVVPIKVEKKLLDEIKRELPETWNQKIRRFKKLGLSNDLANQIVGSEYLDLFEKIIKKNVDPSLVANTFVNVLKDLKKNENIPVENLKDEDFFELFELLKERKLMKEAIPEVLKYKIDHPGISIEGCTKKMGLEKISKEELKKIITEVIKSNKNKPKEKIIGIVMSKVRGRADPKEIVEMVMEG